MCLPHGRRPGVREQRSRKAPNRSLYASPEPENQKSRPSGGLCGLSCFSAMKSTKTSCKDVRQTHQQDAGSSVAGQVGENRKNRFVLPLGLLSQSQRIR